MKITAVQIKFKTGDFGFNLENIIKNINCDSDLIIFPGCDAEELGGKCLKYDSKYLNSQASFYDYLANKHFKQNILLGNVLIKDGKVFISDNGFYDICGKKVFVSDRFIEGVKCDLYVLAKNKYFTINSNFAKSIKTTTDFVYINALCLADENVYAGGSFAKNSNNEFVMQMPLCKEDIQIVDFSRVIHIYNVPYEKDVVDVTTFALNEYCENTGLKKVILGLSGGIDSALTAVLAVKALGAENVLAVLMPSMFSSAGSITDSMELAKNLGIKTVNEPITPLFDAFMDSRERKHDLAEENLQARLRALILMFYSNRENRLLLSTGNKSESAMGFGTLYGDLAGGYNMICDLTKTRVYEVSKYLNKEKEVIPEAIINKAPSAELYPNQKDSDRLPEYVVLDDIIEKYVELNLPIEEIYAVHDRSLVDDVIKKIYKMQFKRYQGCLGVRLTERSFCRGVDFPIVQRFY